MEDNNNPAGGGNSNGRYVSPITSPRTRLGRMQRSDSIPEHGSSQTTTANADASIEELLMRHSSPLLDRATGEAVTSPLAQRNSSPSPLRLNRPRSNPRSRTPMRIDDQDANDNDNSIEATTTEGRRITIRLGAGSSVGTVTYAPRQNRHREPTQRVKSSKQGPSHRKARRWNNSNFVNLASELSSTKGSAAAVEALLQGSAEASKFKSVLDARQHESRAMKQFREDDGLKSVREKFFEGELPRDNIHRVSTSNKQKLDATLTPLERFYRIETRLRKIVTKACENSYAASKVVTALEDYFIRIYDNSDNISTEEEDGELKGILLEVPTVTRRPTDDGEPAILQTVFVFDADSSTGGFHRLLLHAVCQFHGLRAVSSSKKLHGKPTRTLTATGAFRGANEAGLVDFIAERQQTPGGGSGGVAPTTSSPRVDSVTSKLSALKV